VTGKKLFSSIFLLGAFVLLAAVSTGPAVALTEKADLPTLTARADQIVTGEVVRTECFAIEDGRIYTRAVVAVTENLKGDKSAELEVVMPGGTVGDTTMRMSEAPSFTEGESVILFLKNSGNRLAGWFQGKYVVVDGMAYQSAPSCGSLIMENGLPVAELLHTIRTEILAQQ
jgi:hypothetical protein